MIVQFKGTVPKLHQPAQALSSGASDIACHFQAGQQLDITRETTDRRRGNAIPLVGPGKLRPRFLKLSKGRTFVVGAAVDFDSYSALEAALSNNIELRHGVENGNRRKRCHDHDWQMKQHEGLLARSPQYF
jgi:hypothetical protein